MKFLLPAAALVGLIAGSPSGVLAQAVPVSLDKTPEGWELTRGGEPFFVRGAGGRTHLELLAKRGGNSLRTWGSDGLAGLLDEAHNLGLTVAVGMWLGHERHGFDYSDNAAVASQLESCLETVRRFKDHPAVLLWSIGNEMEGEGNNPAVWYAVNHIARECKRIDPNHPTMTVIAELGEAKLDRIEQYCPNIDIVGVNSYGGLPSLATRYKKTGSGKPYIVTEFGPNGPWEVGKTKWGAPLELTSTEKAKAYDRGYRAAVASQAGRCLGSYAFLWGHKQETTATWFGMLLPDGTPLGPVDAMTAHWSGKPPGDLCPAIESLEITPDGRINPGKTITAKVEAADPEGKQLRYQWVVRSDAAVIGVGGDFQEDQPEVDGVISASGATAQITTPKGGGGYRVFVVVRDPAGNAAVANAPFYVNAPIIPQAAGRAPLPHAVYADGSKSPFIPSGYMGNTAAVKMTLDAADEPRSGKTCLKVEYTADDKWGGVLWQSPPNDWDGVMPGGLNLEGASALEFWARGAEGGETVSFIIGAIDGDQPYRDTAKAELKGVALTTTWQKHRIPLEGRDLSRIKTGFGWSVAGQGEPITFYLDDIQYVK